MSRRFALAALLAACTSNASDASDVPDVSTGPDTAAVADRVDLADDARALDVSLVDAADEPKIKPTIKTIPVPGRTFEEALGAAATAQGDPFGDVAFSSHCGLENTYVIDEPSDPTSD